MTKRAIFLPRIRRTVGVTDSPWSWIVCFASFTVQFIALGIQNSFGPFFVEFLKDFGEGESSTAWIGSVSFGLTFMNGPLATALCARWGSRVVTCLGATLACLGLIMTSFVTSFSWLYVTYGIVFGLGSSFCYFSSIAGLTSFFKKHLCLAYGISLAGSGVGTPVMIMAMEHLIGIYGWRSTFRITAAICTVLFLCGLTYLPTNTNNVQKSSKFLKSSSSAFGKESPSPPVDDVTKPVRPLTGILRRLTNLFDLEPFKDCAFAIWVLALGFCIFGYFIPFVFVVRIANDIGASGTQSTLLVAYLAINQTVFKILFGKLGDFTRSKRIIILQVILLIQAIATLLCPLATKYGYFILVIYVVLFGLGDGCWSVMVGMGTELIVGKAMMPRAFGSLYGLISIPLILGPPIAGLIFDKFGSYGPAFILSGSTLIIGIVLMFVVQRMISKRLAATEKTEKAVEVILASSDDIKVVVDFDERVGVSVTHLDTHQLVPWRRHLLEEPYSRPASLVISRLLDDAQSTNDVLHCNSLVGNLASHDQTAFDGYPVITTPKRCSLHLDLEDNSSIISANRECLIMTQLDACSSINSDSGRSTASEETASLKSVRSQASSVDTGFEYDTESQKKAGLEAMTRYGSQDSIYKSSCSLYCEKVNDSIDDVFSKLMEQALEIEKIYLDTRPTSSYAGSEPTQEERRFSWDNHIGTRETVL